MARIHTPFDDFVGELSAWVDSAWFVWMSVTAAIVIVVTIVIIMKVRARKRARVPQYRRET